ncbi:MAG: PLP-dependent transferase [Leptospiraceae bacterium]|nr:PLP-dependent transferase [Leptospiraceae bacterium]
MADVIGYEEKVPAVLQNMQGGYPRFVDSRFLQLLKSALAARLGCEPARLFVFKQGVRPHLLEFIRQQASQPSIDVLVWHTEYASVEVLECKDSALLPQIRFFSQHTGANVSAREAAGLVQGMGAAATDFSGHNNAPGSTHLDAAQRIAAALAELHDGVSQEAIFVGSSGMAAFFAAFRAMQTIQARTGRTAWIQLGWLYLDTIEILRKYSPSPGDHIRFTNVFDLEAIRQYLSRNANRVAGLVCEAPTNPLLQMPDLPGLAALCREFGVALILDPTIASPANIRCLEFADVVVNSLTKYAAWQGDVMLGSLVLNPRSPWYTEMLALVPHFLFAAHPADLVRLGDQISSYKSVLQRINRNQKQVREFLGGHPGVARVYHAQDEQSAANYHAVARPHSGCGALVSFLVAGDMFAFYDRVALPKGPSFGIQSTLLCPFIYLAHYNLIQSAAGRQELAQYGLHPDLLRLSVGLEDPDQICAVLQAGLSPASS